MGYRAQNPASNLHLPNIGGAKHGVVFRGVGRDDHQRFAIWRPGKTPHFALAGREAASDTGLRLNDPQPGVAGIFFYDDGVVTLLFSCLDVFWFGILLENGDGSPVWRPLCLPKIATEFSQRQCLTT